MSDTASLYQPGILEGVPRVARYVNFVIPENVTDVQAI